MADMQIKWITVNVNKTKLMVFRNGGILQTEDLWFYKCEQTEVLKRFCYIGLLSITMSNFMLRKTVVITMYERAFFTE